ncbi:MAG: hypothetical protein KC492_42975 [Myxococcales bacterium]|nr:hypothetical protein [Myxococcales bacterium]
MATLKNLKSLSRALADIAASSRAAQSLGPLASSPNATLDFDLLASRTIHSGLGPLELPLTTDLRGWLFAHVHEAGLAADDLESAIVSLRVRTDRVPTDRARVVLFEFSSSCTLRARSRSFQSSSGPNLVWHDQPAA